MQNGLLAQIILHHFGHKVIDALVVRRAVAGGVEQRHAARPVHAHHAGDADEAFRQKGGGVQIFIADAPVNGAHPLRTGGPPVKDGVVLHVQIAGFGQHRAGLLRQIAVLKVGRVAPPRREDDVDAAGVHMVHDAAEQRAVVAVVHHIVAAEGVRAAPAAQTAGNERIGRAGGDAQVVLQHEPSAVLSLHQVDAGNVAVNALGRHNAVTDGQVSGTRKGEILRDHPVFDDFFVPVQVFQEQIQRRDALHKPPVERVKFRRRDDTGQCVKREQSLLELAVFVNAEFDAVPRQLRVDGPGMSRQLIHNKSPSQQKKTKMPRGASSPCSLYCTCFAAIRQDGSAKKSGIWLRVERLLPGRGAWRRSRQ